MPHGRRHFLHGHYLRHSLYFFIFVRLRRAAIFEAADAFAAFATIAAFSAAFISASPLRQAGRLRRRRLIFAAIFCQRYFLAAFSDTPPALPPFLPRQDVFIIPFRAPFSPECHIDAPRAAVI